MNTTTSQTLISVIIPVFNTGKYLIQCMDSVLRQSYTNLEVILIDDCSTDPETLSLLEGYATKDQRIRLVRNKTNMRQGYSRNLGVRICKGEYFTFIDSDDYVSPDFIASLHRLIVETDADFTICNGRNVISEGYTGGVDSHCFVPQNLESDRLYTCDFLVENMLALNTLPVSPVFKLFNTERYRAANLDFVEDMFYEDNDWSHRVILNLGSFAYADFTGYFRVLRYGSVMHSFTPEKTQDLYRMWGYLFDAFKRRGCFDLYREKLLNYVIDHFLATSESMRWQHYPYINDYCELFYRFCSEQGYALKRNPTLSDVFIRHCVYKLHKLTGNTRALDLHRSVYTLYKHMRKSGM